MSRWSRAWRELRAPRSRTWYVVEDRLPVGFRVVYQSDSLEEAIRWRADQEPRLCTLGDLPLHVMPEDDWCSTVSNLMRDGRFWERWGRIETEARRYREALDLQRIERAATMSNGIALEEIADEARRRRGLDPVQRALHRADVLGVPSASKNESEGVVWENEA